MRSIRPRITIRKNNTKLSYLQMLPPQVLNLVMGEIRFQKTGLWVEVFLNILGMHDAELT